MMLALDGDQILAHNMLQKSVTLKEKLSSLQMLLSEVLSLEPAHPELVSLVSSLCPTAPEERVRQLRDELQTLQRRLHVQNEVIPQRYNNPTQDRFPHILCSSVCLISYLMKLVEHPNATIFLDVCIRSDFHRGTGV